MCGEVSVWEVSVWEVRCGEVSVWEVNVWEVSGEVSVWGGESVGGECGR